MFIRKGDNIEKEKLNNKEILILKLKKLSIIAFGYGCGLLTKDIIQSKYGITLEDTLIDLGIIISGIVSEEIINYYEENKINNKTKIKKIKDEK